MFPVLFVWSLVGVFTFLAVLDPYHRQRGRAQPRPAFCGMPFLLLCAACGPITWLFLIFCLYYRLKGAILQKFYNLRKK